MATRDFSKAAQSAKPWDRRGLFDWHPPALLGYGCGIRSWPSKKGQGSTWVRPTQSQNRMPDLCAALRAILLPTKASKQLQKGGLARTCCHTGDGLFVNAARAVQTTLAPDQFQLVQQRLDRKAFRGRSTPKGTPWYSRGVSSTPAAPKHTCAQHGLRGETHQQKHQPCSGGSVQSDFKTFNVETASAYQTIRTLTSGMHKHSRIQDTCAKVLCLLSAALSEQARLGDQHFKTRSAEFLSLVAVGLSVATGRQNVCIRPRSVLESCIGISTVRPPTKNPCKQMSGAQADCGSHQKGFASMLYARSSLGGILAELVFAQYVTLAWCAHVRFCGRVEVHFPVDIVSLATSASCN